MDTELLMLLYAHTPSHPLNEVWYTLTHSDMRTTVLSYKHSHTHLQKQNYILKYPSYTSSRHSLISLVPFHFPFFSDLSILAAIIKQSEAEQPINPRMMFQADFCCNRNFQMIWYSYAQHLFMRWEKTMHNWYTEKHISETNMAGDVVRRV